MLFKERCILVVVRGVDVAAADGTVHRPEWIRDWRYLEFIVRAIWISLFDCLNTLIRNSLPSFMFRSSTDSNVCRTFAAHCCHAIHGLKSLELPIDHADLNREIIFLELSIVSFVLCLRLREVSIGEALPFRGLSCTRRNESTNSQ